MPVLVDTRMIGWTARITLSGRCEGGTVEALSAELCRLLAAGVREFELDLRQARRVEPAAAAVRARFADLVGGLGGHLTLSLTGRDDD